MNPLVRIASAASVALSSTPREECADAAILDLRGDRPNVARSKLQTIISALGPRLFFHSDLRIFVVAGSLGVDQAANMVSEQLDTAARSAIRIGVVKGEDLTSRIEELTRAGHELRDKTTGCRLIDEPTPPERTWSPASAAPLCEALSGGARVVICQWADHGTVGIATAHDALGWESSNFQQTATAAIAARLACQTREVVTLLAEGIITSSSAKFATQDTANLPDVSYESGEPSLGENLDYPKLAAMAPGSDVEVLSELPDGTVLCAQLVVDPMSASAEKLIEALRGLSEGLRIETSFYNLGSNQRLAIKAHTRPSDALRWMARQIELVCSQFGAQLERPLTDSIEQDYRLVCSSIPRELLEFGCEIRSAEAWIE